MRLRLDPIRARHWSVDLTRDQADRVVAAINAAHRASDRDGRLPSRSRWLGPGPHLVRRPDAPREWTLSLYGGDPFERFHIDWAALGDPAGHRLRVRQAFLPLATAANYVLAGFAWVFAGIWFWTAPRGPTELIGPIVAALCTLTFYTRRARDRRHLLRRLGLPGVVVKPHGAVVDEPAP